MIYMPLTKNNDKNVSEQIRSHEKTKFIRIENDYTFFVHRFE